MPKIIQIISAVYHSAARSSDTYLHALLDDGSVHFRSHDGYWKPVALPSTWMPEPGITTPRQPQRPEWDSFMADIQYAIKNKGFIYCAYCEDKLPTLQQIREHWQLGHFDR